MRGGIRGAWSIALTILALIVPGREALAAVTLAENERGKLEMEIRLMVWALESGPDLLPGVNTAPPPAQEENIHDFLLRRTRLVLRARLSPALEIYTQFGMDNSGSKVLRDDTGFRIKDAFIGYRKADLLQVVAGQFKVPFLRQNLESGFNQLLVDRALVTALRPAIEGQRDLGGMMWGNRGGFQYRAAVLEGSDQEDAGTRSSLRGTARVSWNWFTPEPGLSFTGTTLGQKRILQVGLQGDTQDDRLDARDEAVFTTEARDYRAWAADFFYDQPFGEGWAVTAEGAWLGRSDDYLDAALATRSIDGRYIQAGILLPGHVGPGRLQLAGRWEEIETTRGTAEGEFRARTFGLTWFVKDHDRKIQFDHIEAHERPVDLDDNLYRLSFVAIF